MQSVVFPGAGAGGNFLEQMLGDLMKVMGGANTGGARVELARAMAQTVASDGAAEANPDPAERMRIEELARIAELHVAEVTGMAATPTGSSLEIVAVGPGGGAWQTVEDWRFLLDAMGRSAPAGTAPPQGSPATNPGAPGDATVGPGDAGDAGGDDVTAPHDAGVVGLGLADLDDDVEATPDTAALVNRWLATMGPVVSAVQLASAVGHLARSTLGPYEIPVPRPHHKLLIVPANVSHFAQSWSLDPDEVRLWVCVRSITTHTVLSKAHVAERMRALLVRVVEGMAQEAGALTERFGALDFTEPDALQRLLGDPEAILSAEPSPARARAAAELGAVAVVLVGYVEHVLDRAGGRLLGGSGAVGEAWRRRQVDRDGPTRAAEQMMGLDLTPAQTDRGVAFVRGVLERAGEEGLARLWAQDENLPTPSEVDAPGLWLERIDLTAGR